LIDFVNVNNFILSQDLFSNSFAQKETLMGVKSGHQVAAKLKNDAAITLDNASTNGLINTYKTFWKSSNAKSQSSICFFDSYAF